MVGWLGSLISQHAPVHAEPQAFESFCNKSVAGSSSAELMASFCDNLLKKGGSEKLSDEAIEETLEKVVKLLAFISDKVRKKQMCWVRNPEKQVWWGLLVQI